MLELIDKENCCGCEACLQACPTQCISFKQDEEGFYYPSIDKKLCIDCSLCEKVCPVIHQSEDSTPTHIYAAKNRDEQIRKESSSGGIFTLLAESIIKQGGVVFGAKFDKGWNVIHDYTETLEGLSDFRGSKYVQSRIGNTYIQVKKFLKEGRKVLFSGTPCQVSGIKRFLVSEYENLLLIDFICHGVPSPTVWHRYINEVYDDLSCDKAAIRITSINFRDKIDSWKQYRFTVGLSGHNSSYISEVSTSNIYMRGFLKDLYLRPSCQSCPSKSFKSGSDIKIADFWGIENELPYFDDDKGSNLVIVNSNKGDELYNSIEKDNVEVSSSAFNANPSLFKSIVPHNNRAKFFSAFNEGESTLKLVEIFLRINCLKRTKLLLKTKIKQITKLIIGKSIISKIKKI